MFFTVLIPGHGSGVSSHGLGKLVYVVTHHLIDQWKQLITQLFHLVAWFLGSELVVDSKGKGYSRTARLSVFPGPGPSFTKQDHRVIWETAKSKVKTQCCAEKCCPRLYSAQLSN